MISISNGEYKKYFVIIFMGFLISLLFTSPLVTALSNDKEVFRYIAMLVSKGFVPYRDVFEIRAPIVFFLGAPFAGSEWSFWFLFSTIVAISGVAFYKIAMSVGTQCPYLCTAIYFLLLRWTKLAEGGQFTYELTAAFVVIITLLYVFRRDHSLVLLGILLAIVFFTQQNDILCLLPVAFYAIVSRNIDKSKFWHEKVRIFTINCVLVSLGFISVVLIISTYFFYHGAFLEFINDVFLFAPRYYIGSGKVHSVGDMFFMTMRLLWYTELLPISLIVVISNVYFAVKNKFANNKMRIVVFITTVAMIFAIISTNLSGHYYPHYLLSYGAYLAIQIALFTSYFGNKKMYSLLSYVLVLGTIVMSLFFLWDTKTSELRGQRVIFHTTGDKIVAVYSSMTHNILAPYEDMVADVKGKDGQLYVIGDILEGILSINTNLRISFPSKWGGRISFFPEERLAGIVPDIFGSIERNKTKYILDFSSDATFNSVERGKMWRHMLNKSYIRKAKVVWGGKDGWLYVRHSN